MKNKKLYRTLIRLFSKLIKRNKHLPKFLRSCLLLFVVIAAMIYLRANTNGHLYNPIILEDIRTESEVPPEQTVQNIPPGSDADGTEAPQTGSEIYYGTDDLPPYSGMPYVEVNGNIPFFSDEDLTTESYEYYGDLDDLGRCTMTMACIGEDIMPTEERGSIGSVRPSGWHTVKYDIVDGLYLYNRCHLIGYQLAGENANVKNLITGTRYLNVTGMLPFENQVSDYVHATGCHVLYRVTPVFTGDNLVADGVLMEARSVEDGGEGVTFCVFAYNVQPGIWIDYSTGDSGVE